MLAALLALSQAPTTAPQEIPSLTSENAFPFVIPWDDSEPGTATDVSFLNEKPAGKHGRIIVRSGIFVEEQTGRRVRFLGTNLAAEAAFPTKADADKIAARFAKCGINIVRLHHLNNGWAVETGGSIWKQGRRHIEIDPAQLDRLDYLVSALKRNGIYTNINLQTAREYLPELGFPESVSGIPNFQKKVDKFDERMIQLQQEYARRLLDRKNPYTGLKYKDDPAIAKIEINNENSLVGWPGESPGAGLDGIPEPFLGDLKRKWNGWLKSTYVSDTRLRAAWPRESTLTGPSLIHRGTKWTTENQSNGDVEFKTEPAQSNTSSDRMEVTVRENNGPAWHVQVHLNGLDLEEGTEYTLTFRAKSDRPMTVPVDSRLGKPDWRFLGLGGTANVTPEWKEFAFTFRATGTEPNASRISFVLGAVRGTLTIENVALRKGRVSSGVAEGESLEKGNIGFPSAGVSPQFRDYTRFLVQTERAFSERMRKFLREDLGFTKMSILDSQISWGGTTSLERERSMEFADNHAYWNHPVFLGSDWDPVNYRVDRKALVNEMAGSMGTLGGLAQYRVVGKPYSVSEYDHPAPSDYTAEMMPLLATFAAFQDWDAVYSFSWEHMGQGIEDDKFRGFFEQGRHPAKAAFYPAAALIFRRNLIPAANRSMTLSLPATRSWEAALTPSEGWSKLSAKPNPLLAKVGTSAKGKTLESLTTGTSTSSPLSVRGTEGRRVFVADTPSAIALAGFLGGTEQSIKGGSFRFGATPTNFSAMTLTAMDGRNLSDSNRALLTLVGRAENMGMKWNAARTSVSDQWGTGPSMVEVVPCEVALKTNGPRTVYALEPNGKRKERVTSTFKDGTLTFRTDGGSSVWFEITGT